MRLRPAALLPIFVSAPLLAQPAIADVRSGGGMPSEETAARESLHVTVFAGSERLFDRTLKVSEGVNASFSEELREASDEHCSGGRANVSGGHTYRLDVNRFNRDQGATYNISVQVSRSGPSTDCKSSATRSLGLRDQVQIGSGETLDLRGGDGLVVRVSKP